MIKFLGIINYDSLFISTITELATPLYVLLKEGVKFIFTNKHQKSFQKIKDEWKENLVLKIPNLNIDFTLETIASDLGLGAVLKQDGSSAAYISRSLSKTERSDVIPERETLAVLYAMGKFEYFLAGSEFELTNAHKAIEFIKTKSISQSARIRRWHNRIEMLNFKAVYKPGKEMTESDSLSRLAVNSKHDICKISIESMEKIKELHKKLGHR